VSAETAAEAGSTETASAATVTAAAAASRPRERPAPWVAEALLLEVFTSAVPFVQPLADDPSAKEPPRFRGGEPLGAYMAE
jgi:hypothetical protein